MTMLYTHALADYADGACMVVVAIVSAVHDDDDRCSKMLTVFRDKA